MKTLKSLVLVAFGLAALSGCQTTASMSAKSGSDQQMITKACGGSVKSSSDCDDRAGCSWDHAQSMCVRN